jgi:hypothetical protein
MKYISQKLYHWKAFLYESNNIDFVDVKFIFFDQINGQNLF